MLPSIKESDRYTSEDRTLMAIGGFALTIFAIALNVGVYLSGYIVPYFIVFLFVGPVLMGMSCCAEFKGNIKIVDVSPSRVCPQCGTQGRMEAYDEKVGQHTERQYRVIYTNVKTTIQWAQLVHCRSCGYKGNRASTSGAQRRVGAASAVVVPDDPLAKAQAILAASKKRDGKVSYSRIDTEDRSSEDVELTQGDPSVIV